MTRSTGYRLRLLSRRFPVFGLRNRGASGGGRLIHDIRPRRSRFDTCIADHCPPRAVATPRAVSAAAMPRRLVTPLAWISRTMGSTFAAYRAEVSLVAAAASPRMASRFGFPRRWPRSLAALRASLVRCEMSARSFSASAAYRCRMNGSVSAPSSATINGTLWIIRPLMKWTSRESRSSLAEANEATAHMVSEWKGLRALIHVCRIGEMIGERYSDAQIAAWPRDNGLLTPGDLCSEPWARTFKGDLAAVAKRIVFIRQEQSMKLPVAPAADSSKPMPGGWALVTALDDTKRAAANRPKTWMDEAGLIHVCRVRMMVDAGYTEAQIAVVPRGANGLLPPDAPCTKEANDMVEHMMSSIGAGNRAIELKWHYTMATRRADPSNPSASAIGAPSAP